MSTHLVVRVPIVVHAGAGGTEELQAFVAWLGDLVELDRLPQSPATDAAAEELVHELRRLWLRDLVRTRAVSRLLEQTKEARHG